MSMASLGFLLPCFFVYTLPSLGLWFPLPECHFKYVKGCLILIKWKSSQFSGLLETLIWWGHLDSQNFRVCGFLLNDEIAISTNLEFFLISTDSHKNTAGHGTETTLSRGCQITLPLCHHIELFKETCPDSAPTREVPSNSIRRMLWPYLKQQNPEV